MTYKIIYVDEEQDAHDQFADFVEAKDTEGRFEVISLMPERSLEEMLFAIQHAQADALVSDFRLNEHIRDLGYNVPYDGVELVDAFLKVRQDHPSFVITSFPSDAANESADVNFIYVKNVLSEKSTLDLDFLGRIRIQIDHHRKRLSNAEQRLCFLIEKKDKTELSIAEEEELVCLDNFLESSVDKASAIPSELKKATNEKRLFELLSKVDDLIGKLNDGD